LLEGDYLKAKKLSERIASEMEPPLFYRDKKEESRYSEKIFQDSPLVQVCLKLVEKREDPFGHGLSHVRKVALDAGTLVIIEGGCKAAVEKTGRMALLAQIAGLLHDIKRAETDHARRGAKEAGILLKSFDLTDQELLAIVQAIGNHEAFKPSRPLSEPSMQLLSDALYDADKFRWGPDNFTETVWLMVAPMKVPLRTLLDHFLPSLRGIEKISKTFRTKTGKVYGPDFIERGLKIGNRIYEELEKTYQKP
jgi:hypothetical protein